jgi:pimeloyl-ACP methyl ester carboxylesterase
LLGHSDGASIAAIYCGTVRDPRVRGLILFAPHFFTEPVGLASIRTAKDRFESGDLRDRLTKHHRHVDNTFRGWNDAWLDPKFEKWNISEVIGGWHQPTIAIQGAEDEYGSAKQLQVIEEKASSPVEILFLDGCKHSPHLEQTELTLQATSAFCRRLCEVQPDPRPFRQ